MGSANNWRLRIALPNAGKYKVDFSCNQNAYPTKDACIFDWLMTGQLRYRIALNKIEMKLIQKDVGYEIETFSP